METRELTSEQEIEQEEQKLERREQRRQMIQEAVAEVKAMARVEGVTLTEEEAFEKAAETVSGDFTEGFNAMCEEEVRKVEAYRRVFNRFEKTAATRAKRKRVTGSVA